MIVAKTNMSRFAFTGVGTNPRYGTPGESGRPRARARRLVVGPRRSLRRMRAVRIAIGGDTGWFRCAVPAALCGLVGQKPSRR